MVGMQPHSSSQRHFLGDIVTLWYYSATIALFAGIVKLMN